MRAGHAEHEDEQAIWSVAMSAINVVKTVLPVRKKLPPAEFMYTSPITFRMQFTVMEFSAYTGLKHPATKKLLDRTKGYYALPGGGIATKQECVAWGHRNGIKVVFKL